MAIFKTSKEWARAFLLVSGTLILAGLYFIPVIFDLKADTDLFKHLLSCKEKFELIYMMLVTFYLKEKIASYLETKDKGE